MKTGGGGPGDLKSEINVTPLVDVVLVLLIIFMVATPLLPRGRPMNLSPGNPPFQGGCEDGPDPFVLSLTSDRRIFFEAEPAMDAPALRDRLRQALREEPSRGIRLKADESLRVGDVRTVLHSIRTAGARRVRLAVQVPDEP